jgi:hypothetical protein
MGRETGFKVAAKARDCSKERRSQESKRTKKGSKLSTCESKRIVSFNAEEPQQPAPQFQAVDGRSLSEIRTATREVNSMEPCVKKS